MSRALVLGALLVLSTFGLASATHTSPCTAQNAGGLDQPFYALASGSSVQVWQEANGVAGLQRSACIGPDGQPAQPDAHVTTVTVPSVPRCPIDLGGSPVCIV